MATHTPDLVAPLSTMTQVRTPRAAVWLTWVLLLGLLLLPFALLGTPWTQTVHGGGRAIAFDPVQRPQFLVSPIEGRVMKWHVVEGQRVKAGDPIVDMVDNDPERLKRLEDEEKAIQARLLAAEGRVAAIEGQIGFLEISRTSAKTMAQTLLWEQQARQEVAEGALVEAQTTLDAAEPNYKRLQGLFKNPKGGLASERDVEVAKQQLDAAKARVRQVEGTVKQAKASVTVATENIRKVEADNDAMIKAQTALLKSATAEKESVKQSLLQMQSAIERQKQQSVKAPADGVVWQLLANAEQGGILVRPGERLARLVPDVRPKPAGVSSDPRDKAYPGIVVELGIDGNDLPLVREGDKVRLQFEGWPAVQFAGWPSVAVGTFGGRVYLVDPTANDTGRFRVLVEPDPAAAPWPTGDYLRQGVRAQGWVLLQEVSAGWEIWRQINGFPPTREPKEKTSGRPLGPIGK